MNCKRIENYLLLKPDELSVIEQEEITEHIKNCSSCQQRIAENEKLHQLIGILKDKEPVMSNPGLLGAEIIGKALKRKNGKKATGLNYFEQFLDWFFLPRVKPVLVGLAISMLVFLSYRHAVDQMEMTAMELRLKKISMKPGSITYNTIKYLNIPLEDSSLSQKSKWMRLLFMQNHKVSSASFNLPQWNKHLFLKPDSSAPKSLFKNLLFIKRKAEVKKLNDSSMIKRRK